MIVTLRTASLDDLDIIHAIRRDAILGVPPETGLRDRQTWADRRSPAFFADRVAAGRVVMASSAGDDIGWGSSAEAWITGLYVRTSWSGKGVGRRLMAKLETEIVKRGHACARLASSPNAVGFYTTLGYIPVGLPDGEGAVPMKKRLRTLPLKPGPYNTALERTGHTIGFFTCGCQWHVARRSPRAFARKPATESKYGDNQMPN